LLFGFKSFELKAFLCELGDLGGEKTLFGFMVELGFGGDFGIGCLNQKLFLVTLVFLVVKKSCLVLWLCFRVKAFLGELGGETALAVLVGVVLRENLFLVFLVVQKPFYFFSGCRTNSVTSLGTPQRFGGPQ